MILTDNVRASVVKKNYWKAAGPGGITIEALEAPGDSEIDHIPIILNEIYKNGEMREEMCKSTCIMMSRKKVHTGMWTPQDKIYDNAAA